jgi:hypothetical protein
MSNYHEFPREVKEHTNLEPFFKKKWPKFQENVEQEFNSDKIYRFELIFADPQGQQDTATFFVHNVAKEIPEPSLVVAGSAALYELMKRLKKPLLWRNNDVDLFILNSEREARELVTPVDLVYRTVQTVAELLLGFDLPCCRVACHEDEFFVSEQAFFAIFFGRYCLPSLYEVKSLTALLEKDPKMKDNYLEPENIARTLVRGIEARIKKYQARGFKVDWLDFEEDRRMLPKWQWWFQYQTADGRNVNNGVFLPVCHPEKHRKQEKLIDYQAACQYLLHSPQVKLSPHLRQKLERDYEKSEQGSPKIGEIEEAIMEIKRQRQVPAAAQVVEPKSEGVKAYLDKLRERKKEETKEEKKEEVAVAVNLLREHVRDKKEEKELTAEKEITAELRKLVYGQLNLSTKDLRLALHTQLAKLEEAILKRSLNSD